jgi:conjugative relaxase-like TrwC/TraI family protein
MISVSGIKSSGGAARYYTTQDYYSEQHCIEGAWYGAGAQTLGLQGEPTREAFQAVLEGRLPNGVELRGGASGEHRAGWDFCFAPDKSVSVAGLVYGDQRVVAAHEAAVRATLAKIDAEYTFARVRGSEGVRLVPAGGVVAAMWTHESSRALDPQLHTHVTIANAVQTADGQWRAMESRPLFAARHMLDAVYKAELAQRLQELGYRIEVDRARGTFALADVPKALADAYSQRAAAIEARLAKEGLSRAAAPAQLRAAISEVSRGDKEHMDPAALRAHWQGIAQEHGVSVREQVAVVREASARSAEDEWRQRIAPSEAYAARAVLDASAKLAERDAVFGHEVLLRDAQGLALGRSTFAQIERAATEALSRGDLLARSTETGRAYTTPEAVGRERAVLAIEREGRGALAPVLDRTEAWRAVATAEQRSAALGHGWNTEQKAAAVGVLSTSSRVVAVQGIAGSAKTSTVLATVAAEFRARGHEVVAIAPTASAARELGDALKTDARTLASHLGQLERERGPASAVDAAAGRSVWVVDEASLVSAKDMATLLRGAERAGAQVVLSGDTRQLGSVEAGRAFGQLQAAGMETHTLGENVRQQNAMLRDAVKDAAEGRWAGAMDKMERAGGRVEEIGPRNERMQAVARDYLERDPELRRQTLVVDNTRAGREDITREIRDALTTRGELGKEAVTIAALERRDLTQVEKKLVDSYHVGDTVKFQRDYQSQGITREATYTVERVDKATERVLLRDDKGSEATAWNPRSAGATTAEVYETKQVELRTGDRVAFTRNDADRGIANNDRGTVRAVDGENGRVTIDADRGQRSVTLDRSREADRYVRHGYVQTSYSAQGQTAKEVVMHAEGASPATHQRSQYVQVSRAVDKATLYTDSRRELAGAVERRDGEKSAALDGTQKPAASRDSRANAEAARPAPVAEKATLTSDRRPELAGTAERRDGEKSAALDGAQKPAASNDSRASAAAARPAPVVDKATLYTDSRREKSAALDDAQKPTTSHGNRAGAEASRPAAVAEKATLATDRRPELAGTVERRDGEKSAALDGAQKPAASNDSRASAAAARPAPVKDGSVERGTVKESVVERGVAKESDRAHTRVEVASEQLKTARTFSELAVAHQAHREAKAELAGQSTRAPSIDKTAIDKGASEHSMKSGGVEKTTDAGRSFGK